MDIKIKIENGHLICLKHNKKVKMFIMDTEIVFQDSMLCTKCFLEKPTVQNKIIAFDYVLAMIKRGFLDQSQEEMRQIYLKNLKQFLEKMSSLKIDLIQQIENIIMDAQKWIKYLDNFQRQENLLKDLEDFHSKQFKIPSDSERMEKENQVFLQNLLTSFKVLLQQDRLERCFKHLIAIKNNKGGLLQLNKKIQITQSITYKENCRAIAFNETGSLLATACDNSIKIWSFKNGIIEKCQTILNGHTNWVQCLIFRHNWIISGSLDNTIRGWLLMGETDWISTDAQIEHSNVILGLILNKNENELISCSKDKTIKVWKVNGQTNMILFNYSLESNFQGAINCISLNQSETALVSCSEDKNIILWIKQQNQKWYPSFIFQNDDNAMRVGFISDTHFILQKCHFGISMIFNIEKYEKIVIEQSKQLTYHNANNDEWLFPIFYNKKKSIIIQKHNRYVYIIKKQKENEFKIIKEPIDCLNVQNYGAITDDGDYLLIWNAGSFQIKIFSLVDL